MKKLVISRKDAATCLFLSLIVSAIFALIAYASWNTATDAERMARSTEASFEVVGKTDRSVATSPTVHHAAHDHHFLIVRNLNNAEEFKIAVLQERFDRTNVGATVRLRYDPVEKRWFDPQRPRDPPRVGSVLWGCIFLAFVVLSFWGLVHKRPSETRFFRFE